MAKALMVNSSNGITLANNITRYLACANAGFSGEASSLNAQITYRTAGIFSNLYVRVIINDIDTSSTFRFRKNGATGAMVGSDANGNQFVTVGAFNTGEFEDNTRTDTVAAGDEVNYSVVTGAVGDTPGDLTFTLISIVFAATTGTVVRHATTNFPNLSDGVTYYAPLAGVGVSSTEALAKINFKAAGTVKNLFVYVSQASSSSTNIKVRQNGANTLLGLVCPGSTTGVFENLISSINILANDDLNYSIITSVQTIFILEIISIEYLITDLNAFHSIFSNVNGISLSPNTSYYAPIGGGGNILGVETNFKTDLNIGGTVSNLVLYVSINTIT